MSSRKTGSIQFYFSVFFWMTIAIMLLNWAVCKCVEEDAEKHIYMNAQYQKSAQELLSIFHSKGDKNLFTATR